MIDWKNIFCPVCGEKRKNTKQNMLWFDPTLSDKNQGKMTFFCTNHEPRFYFIFKYYAVPDDISSVRVYFFQDRLPKN